MTEEMTRKERILVVEDNEDAQGGYGGLLRRWDFDVLCVSSAEDALTYFYEYQPALLITDVELPGMDGLTLLSRLGDELRSVPAIIITGKGSEERAVAAIEVGAFWYIEKPLSGVVLRAVLNRAFREIHEHRKVDALPHLVSESGPINEPNQNQDERRVGDGMNQKQRISLITGLVLLVLAGLIPPVGYSYRERYDFVFSGYYRIDWPFLFGELLVIAVVVCGLFFILKDTERRS
jgi:DNA-binding response OmpR family regulator